MLGVRERLIDIFDLPKDIVLDLPRITAIGSGQLLIENHRGIVSFTSEMVVIGYKEGRVIIEGRSFELCSINMEEILLTGEIERLTFESTGG